MYAKQCFLASLCVFAKPWLALRVSDVGFPNHVNTSDGLGVSINGTPEHSTVVDGRESTSAHHILAAALLDRSRAARASGLGTSVANSLLWARSQQISVGLVGSVVSFVFVALACYLLLMPCLLCVSRSTVAQSASAEARTPEPSSTSAASWLSKSKSSSSMQDGSLSALSRMRAADDLRTSAPFATRHRDSDSASVMRMPRRGYSSTDNQLDEIVRKVTDNFNGRQLSLAPPMGMKLQKFESIVRKVSSRMLDERKSQLGIHTPPRKASKPCTGLPRLPSGDLYGPTFSKSVGSKDAEPGDETNGRSSRPSTSQDEEEGDVRHNRSLASDSNSSASSPIVLWSHRDFACAEVQDHISTIAPPKYVFLTPTMSLTSASTADPDGELSVDQLASISRVVSTDVERMLSDGTLTLLVKARTGLSNHLLDSRADTLVQEVSRESSKLGSPRQCLSSSNLSD